ncbi:hypothetical protein GIB67_016953 [Kingdonia uniflora]|uniref:Uncharacterized protein n=1 Tax=Kingdonia uniflora TaxID=39325 RepID=A0A7J7M3G4_9MAGN|nr:hypothetical protein GIB67_016953 [Kingdonia uniflora]
MWFNHIKAALIPVQFRRASMERRSSRGRYKGRGKNRGVDRGQGVDCGEGMDRGHGVDYGLGMDRGQGVDRRSGMDRGHSEVNRFGKSNEPTSKSSSTRVSSVQPSVAPARKHVFASSLNSASLPFYPSSSSNQDVPVTQKRDSRIINKTSSSYPFEEIFSSNSSGIPRGKNVSRSNSHDMNYIDDSIRPVVGKSSNLQSSCFSSVNTTQYMQSKLKSIRSS